MASTRKKQDESNLKTLRELAARPQNKFCFDCGQRGPTYVNVTVGSFVCTKCSGILRGITPPHRLKSISMATFSTEEIDSIRTKGNDYCRNVWLGLYEGGALPVFADEQQVRDFMIEKYERKRYYLEKNSAIQSEVQPAAMSWTNGTSNGKLVNGTKKGSNNNLLTNGVVITNGTTRSRPEVNRNNQQQQQQNGLNNNNFAVDFDKADIFSNTLTSSTGSSQNGFADFEHNHVYNASVNDVADFNDDEQEFSIFDLQFSSLLGPTLNQVPLFPKCWTPSNRWSLPACTTNPWSSPTTGSNTQNGMGITSSVVNSPPPLVEDKYAALKDLDNEMKQQNQQQQQQDVWSTSNTGSTGSLYSSSTPNTGSVYGSPSPQGSIFGSPSQGQFLNAFTTNLQQEPVGNPFGGSPTPWTNGFSNGFSHNNNSNGFGVMNGIQQGFINPFKEQNGKINGISNGLMSNGWGGNPFKMGAVTAPMNPNNPFL
ncbi:hypothetical protein ABEB36_012129 [Hypothenemus hampei]|uniref:Arf-GAP domain-containing protein n=1 Tax=Hypothenemus hampei TaxID=57062 RepID=A0ABD1EAD1_HYPHA